MFQSDFDGKKIGGSIVLLDMRLFFFNLKFSMYKEDASQPAKIR